jgi:UDP-3-O-[3-hydroxymyristoyl] glucosamine N-acyltransferase
VPSAADIAARLSGQLIRGDRSLQVARVASPDAAGPGDVCVLFASVAVAAPSLVVAASSDAWAGAVVVVDDPRAAFAELVSWLHPRPPDVPGVHPSAAVDSTASISEGVCIGPLAVVDAGASVGPGSVLGARCVVGRGVVVGADCRLEPGSILLPGTRLEANVRIGAGSILGSQGFGFLAPDPDGRRRAVPQVGGVIVREGADIGALVAVDRGTLGDTEIGPGARLDNLVQVGHNSRIGAGAVLAGQVGISGSVDIGDGAVLAGQSGVADHRRIGRGATLMARAAAFRDVPDGAVYAGTPARPRARWLKQLATLSRLARRREDPQDGR